LAVPPATKEHPMKINPYLLFNGNCEAAFKFYENIFGGKINAMMRYEGSPAAQQVSVDHRNKIMHAQLAAGNEVLMGSDAPPDRYEPMKGFSVTLNLDKATEAERIFKALSEKGTVRMPLEKTFWAERFGMVTDQFGTPWMINCGSPTS
jgi:PhnB protein